MLFTWQSISLLVFIQNISEEERSFYGFGTTGGGEMKNDKIIILGWSIPLIVHLIISHNFKMVACAIKLNAGKHAKSYDFKLFIR